MADGTQKPIERVRVGDEVMAKDPKTGEVVKKKVEQRTVRQVEATVLLCFSNGSQVETTSEHPFYVEGQGFVPAGELGIGTSIVTRAGPSLQITKVEIKSGSTTVYNMTVEDVNTYFVGSDALWVHNYGNRPRNPDYQQVDWETDLPPTAYPGKSRPHHFQEANKNLLDAADADPVLNQHLNDNYPGWRDSIESFDRKGNRIVEASSPDGLTWHHADSPGKMQLVPRDLHRHFHKLYHPNGFGGFKIWG